MRETLPQDFQTAEYLKEHGMVDMVVPRAELAEILSRLLNLLMNTDTSFSGNAAGRGGARNTGHAAVKTQGGKASGHATKALKQVKAAQAAAQSFVDETAERTTNTPRRKKA